MTPEQQRIAIAEACPSCVEWHDGIPYWKGHWSSVGQGNEHLAEFHPLSDLNAMYEAEKRLAAEQWRIYSDKLMVAVRDSDLTLNGSNIEARYKTVHATAAQRAEAFLRTKGLWKTNTLHL